MTVQTCHPTGEEEALSCESLMSFVALRLIALIDEKLVIFIYPAVCFVDKDLGSGFVAHPQSAVLCHRFFRGRTCFPKRCSQRPALMLASGSLRAQQGKRGFRGC